jgi:uncharacterized membrane protein
MTNSMDEKPKNGEDESPLTFRIEAFSDGVFAIVITLLILELKISPPEDRQNWYELLISLSGLAPKFLGFVMSFFFVAVFWFAHHQFFHTIKISTRAMVWLNVLFLFFVTFIPFPTAILGENPNNVTAVVLFGATFFAASGVFAFLRWYGWVKHEKTSDDFESKSINQAMRRTFLIPILYLIGICVSFFSTKIAIGLYFLTPILLVIPLKLERVSNKQDDIVI